MIRRAVLCAARFVLSALNAIVSAGRSLSPTSKNRRLLSSYFQTRAPLGAPVALYACKLRGGTPRRRQMAAHQKLCIWGVGGEAGMHGLPAGMPDILPLP
eukprot:6207067-Pleurochrysis_carterae.AAC.3